MSDALHAAVTAAADLLRQGFVPEARAVLERAARDHRPAAPVTVGCTCPPRAEATCAGLYCPRRGAGAA
jgi:hypothetical protein